MIARSDKARRVQQRIYADRPQCVAVVGDPRIGKSSFLAGLAAAGAAGGPDVPAGTRFVSLALKDAPLANPDAFLRTVIERAPAADGAACRISTLPAAGDEQPRAYAAFERLVQQIAAENGRLIVFCDDFDIVTRSSEFPLQFFSFLRSLANNFPVAYVTTSRLDLQQLCALKEVEESPFFNIFQNVTLGPMDEAQTRALAAERGGGPGDGPLASWAWAESAGLPAVTTACCAAAAAGAVPGAEESTAALDAEAQAYFDELWEHLDAQHRTLMARIARGEPPGERDTRPLRDLGQRRGYLVERDGRWMVASPALQRSVELRSGGPSSPGLFTRLGRFFRGPAGGGR